MAKAGTTQWFKYTDGLPVQVTSLKRFRIGQYAAGGKPGDVGVVVTVTLRNTSSSTFDSSLVDVKVASGPDGDQADTVFDTDQNVAGGFEGSIPPGKKKSARYGLQSRRATSSRPCKSKSHPAGTTRAATSRANWCTEERRGN